MTSRTRMKLKEAAHAAYITVMVVTGMAMAAMLALAIPRIIWILNRTPMM